MAPTRPRRDSASTSQRRDLRGENNKVEVMAASASSSSPKTSKGSSKANAIINNISKVQMVKCIPSYLWTIDNFCACQQVTSEALASPVFNLGNDLKWTIHLYPRGFDREFTDYVSLFLQYESNNEADVTIKYRFAFINDQNERIYDISSETERVFAPGCDWGFREFVLRDHLLKQRKTLLPNGQLRISCEIEIVKYHKNVFAMLEEPQLKQKKQSHVNLMDDLDSILRVGRFHDVTLIVKEKKFHVHKAILAARSPVFSAMFDHDMQERLSNVVELGDVELSVMNEFLRYIYTSRVEDLHKYASNLLPAADKYALDDLKAQCEDAIGSKLTVDTVLETLALADCYNAATLKEKAMEFIITHADKITNSEDFQELINTKSNLINEIFQAMAQRCKTNNGKKSEKPQEPPNKKRRHSDGNNGKPKST